MFSKKIESVYLILILATVAYAAPAHALPDSSPRISSLSWFTGCWRQARPEGQLEEYWTAPRGRSMLGMARVWSEKRTEFFESWHVREHEGQILATVTINGKRRVEFALIESGGRKAVFQTPAINPPERLTYERESAETLYARLEKSSDGKPSTDEFRMQKIDCTEMPPEDAVTDKGGVMPNRSNPPIRYILFHTPGPKWNKAIPFNNQPGVEKHVEYMSQLMREGSLVMGGPFLDNSGGMAVLQTATIEETLEIGQADPAVKSGLLNVAVRAWIVPMARGGSAPKSPPRNGEAP